MKKYIARTLMFVLFVMACAVSFASGGAAESKFYQETLPPIPATVVSQLGPTKVLIVPGLKCGEIDALGCYSLIDHTIRIRGSDSATTVTREVQWQTLYHEEFHMMLADAGRSIPNEDSVADILGSYRVMEMRAQYHLQ